MLMLTWLRRPQRATRRKTASFDTKGQERANTALK